MNITEALNCKKGQTLFHTSMTNRDGTPKRCRVNGKCKTWKTDPTRYMLPVKAGLYSYGYISPDNEASWSIKA